MIALGRREMSAILKEMALTTVCAPRTVPSAEAVGVALLLSHVAWQRANGDAVAETAYAPVLAKMLKARPDLWTELTSSDTTKLITDLVAYKQRHFPHDRRRVLVCGTVDHKVHVEWTD